MIASLLDDLLNLFPREAGALGDFNECEPSQMTELARQLLAHSSHMTVTLEAFHGSAVEVEVLRRSRRGDLYCREIILRRTSDRRVVLFGIVKLFVGGLSESVKEAIYSERVPLGRILIENDVLREVHCEELYEIECGRELARLFDSPVRSVTYGRTACMLIEGEPALELLEVIAPLSTD